MKRHVSPREMSVSNHQATNQAKRVAAIPFHKILPVALLSVLFVSFVVVLRFSFAEPMLRNAQADNVQKFVDRDLYMGGLLPFRKADDVKCRSRSQHHFYRKPSRFKPSEYLISKLRQYEELHRQCAAEVRDIHQVLDLSSSTGKSSCQFVVWVNYSGLGNKLVTLAASFLYALLTNRVLLVDRGTDLDELLCEPFPGASWLLPSDFPRDWLLALNETSPHRFGHLIDTGKCVTEVGQLRSVPDVVYLHLTHTYNVQDRRFFCEEEQKLLKHARWLFIKSNNYFVPSLYFMPTFRAEIDKMFPDLQTVFHHLGRYLLHPSNPVWTRAVRYYESYLAESDLLVGLQLRTFDGSSEALKLYLDEVLECVLQEKILPNVTHEDDNRSFQIQKQAKSVSVLVTSLHQFYYEKLRDLYLQHSTEDNSRVRIQLPSHEGFQKTDKAEHDQKALMEIVLLSMCDRLVTSPMSTFGYVAQGLGGVTPAVLRRVEDRATSQPACSTAVSMDPCFHAPPLYDCDCQGGRDPAKVLQAVKNCRDVPWGIQLVN